MLDKKRTYVRVEHPQLKEYHGGVYPVVAASYIENAVIIAVEGEGQTPPQSAELKRGWYEVVQIGDRNDKLEVQGPIPDAAWKALHRELAKVAGAVPGGGWSGESGVIFVAFPNANAEESIPAISFIAGPLGLVVIKPCTGMHV